MERAAVRTDVVKPAISAYQLVGAELELVEKRLQQMLQSSVELVRQVAGHLLGSGGKRIRPALLLLTARMTGADPAKGVDLAAATELFHNASLLHDDVVDRGHFRRGVAAAPRVYGNSASVLVGDFLLARALGLVVRHGNQELTEALSEIMLQMAEGEVLQLVRSGRATLALENYLEVISGKTAGLFSWCALAGASLGTAEKELLDAAAAAGRLFGMIFQITDDILDYTAPVEQSGKDLANDLEQGKVTLPLLMACEEDGQLMALVEHATLVQPTTEILTEIIRRVKNSRALDRAKNFADNYLKEIEKTLGAFGDSPFTKAFYELATFVTKRLAG
jgi:octaprenyl-diphosphate synthase